MEEKLFLRIGKKEKIVFIALVILVFLALIVNIFFSAWSQVKMRDVITQNGIKIGQQNVMNEVINQLTSTGRLEIKGSDGKILMTLLPETTVEERVQAQQKAK